MQSGPYYKRLPEDVISAILTAGAGWMGALIIKPVEGWRGERAYSVTQETWQDRGLYLTSVPVFAYETATQPLYWGANGARKLWDMRNSTN